MIKIGTITAEIRFNAGTVERIFADPEHVLADVEGFWEAEEAMRYARGWHSVVNVPVDWDHFRILVGQIAELTTEQRAQHPALLMTRRVMEQEQRFLDEGLPHLCSFLPGNPAVLDIRVLFAGGLRAYAFAHEQVVIDVTSKHWHATELSISDRASHVLNLLVHECWHGGYSENQAQWTETAMQDETLHRMLVNIQNEGIATYVNYTARAIFPARAERDFQMLDDPIQAAAKLEGMNAILAQRHALDEESMRKLVWDEGVMGRAFYIGGAHMARVLDERAGRSALNDTIAAGPVSFVDRYNEVADHALRVQLPVG